MVTPMNGFHQSQQQLGTDTRRDLSSCFSLLSLQVSQSVSCHEQSDKVQALASPLSPSSICSLLALAQDCPNLLRSGVFFEHSHVVVGHT